ncbi:MAG: HAD-IA family hydrolase [Cellvibrio sp.]|nr:HAD-IA family hydrolase [Cellvibrio sp.]
MKKNIRAVIFDLDGTLLDTAPDFVLVVNKLLHQYDQPALDADLIRSQVSNGAKALVKLAFAMEEDDPEFEIRRLQLLDLYLQHIADYTRPFTGIENLIQTLEQHQIAWGIATNKPARYTNPLMQALNMQPAPFSVICPDHVTHVKPDPESLLLASKQLHCSTDQIIYVGDHLRDIECGKRAGSITIAAAYGYIDANDSPESWNADYLVNSAEDIWPIVQGYL